MITEKMAGEAAKRLSALKFYPSEVDARLEIADMLQRMVPTADQLEWLVRTMVDRIGEWPGPREMRAVFCTRFRPMDGIEAWSQISGFTALDSEAASLLEHGDRTMAEISEARVKGGLLTPGAPRLLSGVTMMCEAEVDEARGVVKAFGQEFKLPDVPATPKRTKEENERIVRELERKLEQRRAYA